MAKSIELTLVGSNCNADQRTFVVDELGRIRDWGCGHRCAEIFEHGSDWHETLRKRVSNDSGRFVFRCQQKLCWAKILDQKFRFSSIWRGFGGATAERTSKSASTSNFALDTVIERSVRPKNYKFGLGFGLRKTPVNRTPVPQTPESTNIRR